jgi:hypothetical protein
MRTTFTTIEYVEDGIEKEGGLTISWACEKCECTTMVGESAATEHWEEYYPESVILNDKEEEEWNINEEYEFKPWHYAFLALLDKGEIIYE